MISKNYISLSSCIIIISIILNYTVCFGQKIALKDVAKIEFIKSAGGWFVSNYRRVEVVPEKNDWRSYQNRLYKSGDIMGRNEIRDSSTIFIRTVPRGRLNRLLTIIAQQKEGINFNLFNIQKNGLIKYIDSTSPHLKPQQRAELVKAIRSDTIVKKAFNEMLKPFIGADKTRYWIIITTKANKKFTIDAFENPYKLPWNINGIKSYDPNLSWIFEYVGSNNKYGQYEQSGVYKEIDRHIYWPDFSTKFGWDDFKRDEPVSYMMLKDTFTPAYFWGNDEKWYVGEFRALKLPQYLQIHVVFNRGDTAAINPYKRYVDTLANVFKKNNFLFDYLKRSPGCVVYLDRYIINGSGKYFFKEIKQYYPAIDSLDYKQSLVLDVRESNGMQSKWLVLPNNTLVLGLLSGTVLEGNQINFMNIPISVQTTRFNKTFLKSLCIVFDSSGKIIANPDNASMGMY